MAVDPSERIQSDKSKFADLKRRLKSLPLVERVALEVRLAKDLGIAITPAEMASIATPTLGRTRIDDSGAAVPAPSRNDWGGTDLVARRSMAGTLKAMGLGDDFDAGSVREAIKRLSETGDYDRPGLGPLIRFLHQRLELLAARGDHPDLVQQGKAAFAKTVFRAASPEQAKQGPGGAPNR